MGKELRIELVEADADPETVDDLTAHLRRELLELDVDSVVSEPAGPAPEGSKGLDAATVGVLLLQVQSSLPLITAVLSTVRTWLGRGRSPGRRVKVSLDGRTLELSAATPEQQQQLVEEFVRSVRA